MNHAQGCWILSTTQCPLGLSFFFFFFFFMLTAFLLSFFYLLLFYSPSAWTISPHNCHTFFFHVNSFSFIILLSSLIVWPIGLDNKYIKSTQLSFIFFHVNSFSFIILLLYGPSAWTINILSPHNCHSFFFSCQQLFFYHSLIFSYCMAHRPGQ
jgi:hypothetical protein